MPEVEATCCVGERDPLYREALSIVTTTGNAGISHLQRKLGCRYLRAERMLTAMEAAGIVSIRSPVNGMRIVLRTDVD